MHIETHHETLTVKELKALLEKLPDDTEVDFLGYGMGGTFYEHVRSSDFIFDVGKNILIIKAD